MTEPAPIAAEARALGPWFHNLQLPDGSQTAPESPLGDFPNDVWRALDHHLPADLSGWRALDIGCNSGFYSIKLAQRGAQVLAIDIDEHYLAQARWTTRLFGVQDSVEIRRMQVYELAQLDVQFDLVFFMGVLYHLRYPMLGLDLVAQKVRRLLVFQSLTTGDTTISEQAEEPDLQRREALRAPGWPTLAFIEQTMAGDPTNWWVPNHAAVQAMLRSTGMRILSSPGTELYLCEPDPDHPASVSTWNRSELLAATGRAWR